jgi:hypothetical protein
LFVLRHISNAVDQPPILTVLAAIFDALAAIAYPSAATSVISEDHAALPSAFVGVSSSYFTPHALRGWRKAGFPALGASVGAETALPCPAAKFGASAALVVMVSSGTS